MNKHEVATWNLRNHHSLCLKTGKPRKPLWRWLIAELLRPLFICVFISVPTSHRTVRLHYTDGSVNAVGYRRIITVYCEHHAKNMNALCQNEELISLTADGTFTLKG